MYRLICRPTRGIVLKFMFTLHEPVLLLMPLVKGQDELLYHVAVPRWN